MSERDVVFVTGDAQLASSPEPGMLRQVLAYNPHLMLVRHHLEGGWVGTRHSHPHDQIVYVVNGHIRFEAGGKSSELRSGDSVVVNGGVEHQASALANSEVLDIFTPCREDYAR
jgi:quercetin dioxygenase-like cupin family protein